MDASALLCRMERLNQEISMLRGPMEAQATVSENLGQTTVDLECRLMEILKGGIIGTGTVSNFKTKLLSIFATRFSPDLDADIVCGYLTEKLGQSVTCRKIDSMGNRFSSFHITAECNEVAEMYDLKLWLAGVYLRHYFEARKPKNNSVCLTQGFETGTLQEYSENASAPVAPQMTNAHVDPVNK
ncbi:hypothetical protein GOODEAATRI_010981 [Goodea atripinnis]|uniref:Uncharacterized protein n=1 Tax=Goodea atripinnis TaxID=208336 RepID=A0ABV0NJ98_9TELE